MRFLVTGGLGFIGSAVVRQLLQNDALTVLNIDKETYASDRRALAEYEAMDKYLFEKRDIRDREGVARIVSEFKPDVIMHLAAESHVDRSIDGPRNFVESNIVGTFELLEVTRGYWANLEESAQQRFRFHHISTDEVFGALSMASEPFDEDSPYSPNSPYSASKAASDHLVRAWHNTYGIPTLLTNCSNNFGPFQNPEKLIPLMILNALQGLPLPIYGSGKQIRDWLYVEDHATALIEVALKGRPGETYNIGAKNEITNLELVEWICNVLEESGCSKPRNVIKFSDLITFVEDRPGHDQRYAIDARKIRNELGWHPSEPFEKRLKDTVAWYVSNREFYKTQKSTEENLYQRIGLGQRK
mgnify:CR=1 FL=1